LIAAAAWHKEVTRSLLEARLTIELEGKFSCKLAIVKLGES